MSPSEQALEQRLQKLQKPDGEAPRLKPADIDAAIVSAQYHVFEGTNHTVCCLKLKSGFTVVGENACVSAANWNADIGRELAMADARNKVWQLEGYLLSKRLAEQQA